MIEAKNKITEVFGLDPSNLYEVLDIKPDATPKEIREAYLRIKTTYSKDSVALYSLVEMDDRDDILRKIDQAYAILSNPERRKAYDQGFDNYLTTNDVADAQRDESSDPECLVSNNVVSIDRVPPMEPVENAESALVAPITDFGFQSPIHSLGKGSSLFNPSPAFSRSGGSGDKAGSHPKPVLPPPITPKGEGEADEARAQHLRLSAPAEDIEVEIQAETEWSGAFLRKIREQRGISIEDITQATRITKAYILAIEEENMAKLPAPVYIRGFVNQISRLLRLANQDIAAAYMRRCQRLHPEKFR